MIQDEIERKQEHVLQEAHRLYCQAPDWATFFREIVGLRGLIRQVFPTRETLAEFEKTDAYAQIQRMLGGLRQRGPGQADRQEPTRIITVRLPKSMHDALRVEAHEHCTSMNKLCISKLLQIIDEEKVPTSI